MKKRIALLAALAVVLGSAFVGIGAASTGTTKIKTITVTATDFHFRLSSTIGLKHGTPVIFKLVNKGPALHNFDIQGVKATKVIPAGKTVSMKITFKKAGKYQYVCDVPRHIELGMAGTLRVR
ncbi:MAG TPA: cupredoxin domain-containing protein [Gaiellaceae bacterium]|jgi:plastocyanin|nr:cupredoxin domain-containing protein [Gaiellaceae bacterium]